MHDELKLEIAACAARLVVEDGLDYAAAKRKALRQLDLPERSPLPDNVQLDAAVREHIALFCPDTQAQALRVLRELAAVWMARLAEFRPHLSGPVWSGTATRASDLVLQLFCDDPKSAEWTLIDRGQAYEVGSAAGAHGEAVDVLSLRVPCPAWGETVALHLLVHDADDLRQARRLRADGRPLRGDLPALQRLMHDDGHARLA